MKVALIHEWLVVNAGSEKVVQEILKVFPAADVFTVVDFLPEKDRGWLSNINVTTSFIQRFPKAQKHYRKYLPFFPVAVEQFDLSSYDLVISSSHAVAKGVITGPDQLHVCYCHSPARYAWDLQSQYLRESGLDKGFMSMVTRYILHRFRIWDIRSSFGVDKFLANSSFIQKRIMKCYRREAKVIYPPVDITNFSLCKEKSEYFLTASRMVPYKKIDLIVEAFKKRPEQQLKVIGTGPDFDKISALAQGAENIELLGYQDDESLITHMQQAKGFVFAAEEDFGILPVEAQACGTPVIALAKGGTLETVMHGKTGIHFKNQSVDDLVSALDQFDSYRGSFDAAFIRNHAESFSAERFRDQIKRMIDESYVAYHKPVIASVVNKVTAA
ncbi:glycosyltransferase family 4 protein [Neiella marina]|uniref:Glycosyltransferase family 4 protein n=1 Tax=Neiella holothuriorum TaxID=2870530 RepID=A0ABS7EE24_9GAMM|nr:glycosyltransferase family 4 protein [Neiella holothuriorum]MBW8190578.1 glycosyltransferase family 4 protein [Neiella holothuriorum]